jgi:hypothetical protein
MEKHQSAGVRVAVARFVKNSWSKNPADRRRVGEIFSHQVTGTLGRVIAERHIQPGLPTRNKGEQTANIIA